MVGTLPVRGTAPRLSVHGAPSAFVRRVDSSSNTLAAAVFGAEAADGPAEDVMPKIQARPQTVEVSATPYEVALDHREALWASGVKELLRCADELALGDSGAKVSLDFPAAAVGPPGLAIPCASRRQRKLDEVLQRRLQSLRFLAEQQAFLGSHLDCQAADLPDQEQQVLESRRQLAEEGDALAQRMSLMAEAQACLADAEQRCEQEVHARKSLLQQRQDEIDECTEALAEVERLYGEQEVVLAEMRRKLVNVEAEAENLVKERMSLEMQRQEVEVREVSLRCMESAWEDAAHSCTVNDASGTLMMIEFGATRLATELLRSEPYLRRLHKLVDTVVNSSAVSSTFTPNPSDANDDSRTRRTTETVRPEACVGGEAGVNFQEEEAELREESSLQWEVALPTPVLSMVPELPRVKCQAAPVPTKINLETCSSAPTTPLLQSVPDTARASEADSCTTRATAPPVTELELPVSCDETANVASQHTECSAPDAPDQDLLLGRLVPRSQSPLIPRPPSWIATPAPAPPRRTASAPPETPRRVPSAFTQVHTATVNVSRSSRPSSLAASTSSSATAAAPVPLPFLSSGTIGSLLAPRIAQTARGTSPQLARTSRLPQPSCASEEDMPLSGQVQHVASPAAGGDIFLSGSSPQAVAATTAIGSARPMTMSPFTMSPRSESPCAWRSPLGLGSNVSVAVAGTPKPAPAPRMGFGTMPSATLGASASNIGCASGCRNLSPSPRAAAPPPPIKPSRRVPAQLSHTVGASTASANSASSNSLAQPSLLPCAGAPHTSPASMESGGSQATTIITPRRVPVMSSHCLGVAGAPSSGAPANFSASSLQNLGFGAPCYSIVSPGTNGGQSSMANNGPINNMQVRLVAVSARRA